METSSIFIAFPVKSSSFSNKELESLFITGTPDYLTKLEIEGEIFLGKTVNTPVSSEDLEGIGQNVLSLISRIYPNEKLNLDSLIVFPNNEG